MEEEGRTDYEVPLEPVPQPLDTWVRRVKQRWGEKNWEGPFGRTHSDLKRIPLTQFNS